MIYENFINKLNNVPEKNVISQILTTLDIDPHDILDYNIDKGGVVMCLRKDGREYYMVVQDVTEGG